MRRSLTSRSGLVYVNRQLAGTVTETEGGYVFAYEQAYLDDPSTGPVSLTLPKRAEPYVAQHVFPAFCGLLAEGGLAEMHCQVHRLDMRDTFGRLLETCRETIGAVTVHSAPGSPTRR